MDEKTDASLEPTPEQLLYARVLEIGMYIGLLLLFATFAIYALGIMDPYIPLNEISRYWTPEAGGVDAYLREAKIETGWGWVSMLGHGDFLNFVGIAILAGVSIICYLAIVPGLLKSKDKTYALLALLEVIILSVAASGIIEVGH
jgi:hypothetical protein